MRLSIHRHMHLLNNVKVAQFNHQLSTIMPINPNPLFKNTIRLLLKVGFLSHLSVFGKNINPKPTYKFKNYILTLRYWEGKPVVYLCETPMVTCKLSALQRRFKQGRGEVFLLWAQGSLKTGDQCLSLHTGGCLVGIMCG